MKDLLFFILSCLFGVMSLIALCCDYDFMYFVCAIFSIIFFTKQL